MKVSDIASLLHLEELSTQLDGVGHILAQEIAVANDALGQPGQRVVNGGGKRLRPILAIAAAQAVGGPINDDVLRGGAALELVHVGSLVHDDIIDHAEVRRSVPTVNAVEGPSHALLVGDFLLARAGYLAAITSQEVATSLAVAISELCIGQSLETATVGDPYRSLESYYESINGKTAALIRAACRIGAQSGGADEAAVEALSEYGTNFGYAFQIIDDILDIVATSEELGKPSGHDMLEGVFTLPALLYFLEHEDLREKFAVELPTSVDDLLVDLRTSDALTTAIATAEDYADRAREALAVIAVNPTLEGLADLPAWYVEDQLRAFRARA